MITKTLWSSEHNEGAQNKRVRHALNTRPEHTGFAVNGGNGTRDATVWMAKLLPLPGSDRNNPQDNGLSETLESPGWGPGCQALWKSVADRWQTGNHQKWFRAFWDNMG